MDAVTIDEKIKSIEQIIKDLEKEDIAIEDALDLYTKGKVAIEECKNKIDMIEKEVLKINPDGSEEPFENLDF